MNPNSRKYFDPNKGCTYNSKCNMCKCKIYVPEMIQTIYHGKHNYTNIPHNDPQKNIVSVYHIHLGALCINCWEKYKDRKNNE